MPDDLKVKSTEPRLEPAELATIAARCFQGADGRQFLNYLRATTIERTLGPGVDVAHLRFLEGQRQLVQHITTLIERGRNGTLQVPLSNNEQN